MTSGPVVVGRLAGKLARIRQDRSMREAGLAIGSLAIAQGTIMVVSLVRVPFLTKYLGVVDFGHLSTLMAGLPLLLLPSLATRSAVREGVGASAADTEAARRAELSSKALLTRQVAWIVGVAACLAVLVAEGGAAAVAAAGVAAAVVAATLEPSRAWGVLEGEGRVHLANLRSAKWTVIAGVLAVAAAFVGLPLWVIVGCSTLAWCGVAFSAVRIVGVDVGRQAPVLPERYARYWARGIQEFSSRNLMVLVAAATSGPATAGAVFVLTRLSNLAMVVPVALGPFMSRRASMQSAQHEIRRMLRFGTAATCLLGAVIAVGAPWALSVLITGDVALDNTAVVYALTGVNTAILGTEFLFAYARPSTAVRAGTTLSLLIAAINLGASLAAGAAYGVAGILVVSCLTSAASLAYYVRRSAPPTPVGAQRASG